MHPDTVRNLLEQYVNDNGVKYNFIAQKIGISKSMLSYWRKGQKELGKEKLYALYKYVTRYPSNN